MAEPGGHDELHPEEIDSLFKDLDAILAQTPGGAEAESAPLPLPEMPADRPMAESAADLAGDNVMDDPLWQEMTLVPAESAAALAERGVGRDAEVPGDGLADFADLMAGEKSVGPVPPPDGMPTLAELLAQSEELAQAEKAGPVAAGLPPAAGLSGETEILAPVKPPPPPDFAAARESRPREKALPDFSLDALAVPLADPSPAADVLPVAAVTAPAAAIPAAKPGATPPLMPADTNDQAEWLNCGNAWRARGAFGRAAECYERALAIDPRFVKASCNLAGVLFELGERRAAEKHLRAGLKLEPGNQVLKENLAGLQRAERRKREW